MAEQEPHVLRPQQYLSKFNTRYPDAWRLLACFRNDKGSADLGDWPSWCYVPLAGAHAIVESASGGAITAKNTFNMLDIAPLGALAAWRLTKGVYRFDPTVFDAVWNTPADGELPVELFYSLPEWCVYVEVPPRPHHNKTLHGFFVFIDYEVKQKRPELRFLLDVGEERLEPYTIPLATPTLAGVFDSILDSTKQLVRNAHDLNSGQLRELEASTQAMSQVIQPLLSLTLYLCSATAEMRDAKGKRERPGNPEPRKGKKGGTLFAAEGPTVWETGYRMGTALRGALAKESTQQDVESGGEGSSKSKAPHVRRAHWHTFLAGPRTAQTRERRLKWLPPIPVGIEDYDELPAIIHLVK